jgi:MscS family membrane protein
MRPVRRKAFSIAAVGRRILNAVRPWILGAVRPWVLSPVCAPSLSADRPPSLSRVSARSLSAVGARVLAAVSVSCLLAAPTLAWAQLPGLAKTRADAADAGTAAAEPATPEAEAPDSPRAGMREFLRLAMRRGDFEAASRYLVLPPGEEGRGPELARRLRAVLERQSDVKLDALSAASEGNRDDGLPEGVDRVGQVPDGQGGLDTVFLVRTRTASGARWAFSGQTVSRIDAWYDGLPDRWIREALPERLQRTGPWGVMWWQWLALPVLAAVALVVGRVVGGATTRLLHRIFRRTPSIWDERLLKQIGPALTVLWTVGAAAVLLPWLGLRTGVDQKVRGLLGGFATVGFFWVLWRAVDVWSQYLMERPWALTNPSARSLLSVTRNLARIFVAVTGLVAALNALGYPVATVLAGLGIGGIAIAFGAQKTIENLFGSISIAADQPFRVGDVVKVEDITGVVERIGMRSTQIRTPDRTLVTLPNGKLADMRVEDFAARDRIRFATTLQLVHGTSEEQLRRIVADVEALLRAHPKVWPETVVVSFASLGPSSLNVEVLCWFQLPENAEYRTARQETLLGILRIVEAAGARFAFPTQTLHVVGTAPVPEQPQPE